MFGWNIQEFLIYFLILIRISSIMLICPIFSIKHIPGLVKIGFSMAISLLIFPLYSSVVLNIRNMIDLVMYIGNEILIGLMIGYVTLLIFNSIRMAGSLIDFNIGFSMSQYYDSSTNSVSSNIEKLFNMIAILLFITLDFHHTIISGVLYSFNVFKLGHIVNIDKVSIILFDLFKVSVYTGIKIAAPIIFILFLTDFILGLIARSVPQINVFLLGMSLKVLVGLIVLGVMLGLYIKLFIHHFDLLDNNLLKLFSFIPILLSTEDKTEEPTPKKLKDAREKGQVAKSVDLNSAITLVGIVMFFIIFGDTYIRLGRGFIVNSINSIRVMELDYKNVMGLFKVVLKNGLIAGLPIMLTVMILGILANIAQVGLLISKEGLKPQLSKLNPIEGFKRIFSKRSLLELIKSIIKISIIFYISYKYVYTNIDIILSISDMSIDGIIHQVSKILNGELLRLVLILIVIGIIDYIIQKRQLKKELRMTKEELKEEMKQTEGNPQIKSRLRQKQREFAMRRMMQEVPKATVVITNPTHFAVALKYDKSSGEAPKVIAKGADYLALRIKEIAKDANVPIVENKLVARALYKQCEIGDFIPMELYQAVAEIIAYIYYIDTNRR